MANFVTLDNNLPRESMESHPLQTTFWEFWEINSINVKVIEKHCSRPS